MQPTDTHVIDRARFAALARRWSEETRFDSSTTRIAAHPACREIVAMGEAVIPLLLGELETRPSVSWLLALKEVSRADPVPAEDRGDVGRMAGAWLAWGIEHGYRG